MIAHIKIFLRIADTSNSSRKDAVLIGFLRNQFTDTAHFGMVQFTRYTKTVGVIAGAEEDHVNAGHLTDFVDLLNCLRIFNLYDNKTIAVCFLVIFLRTDIAEQTVSIAAINRTATDGIKTSHFSNLAGIFCGHNMRYHDTGCIQFQRADVVGITAARNTNNGISPVRLCSKNLLFQYTPVIRNVFGAGPNTVNTVDCHHFDDTGISGINFQGKRRLTCTEFVEYFTFSKMHTAYLFSILSVSIQLHIYYLAY